MFDLVLTLALVYFGYRVYNWYQRTQQEMPPGPPPPSNVRPGYDEPIDVSEDRDDDYIDYEEVK